MSHPELERLRTRLDALDDELIDVLARRAALVKDIWAWKQREHVAQIDPAREAALKARLLALAETRGLSREAVARVLEQIVGLPLLRRAED
ncbi:MAG: chorismate mutase [Myxococcaceae bacterium]